MNALSVSAAAGVSFAAMLIVVNFFFKWLLSFRGFGTTPMGAGLASIVV